MNEFKKSLGRALDRSLNQPGKESNHDYTPGLQNDVNWDTAVFCLHLQKWE